MSALVFLFLKGKTDMKLEGQVRIPSGCAIAAVISKEGKRMSGEMITAAQTDSAAVLPATEYIPNTEISTHYICFSIHAPRARIARCF